MGAALTKPGETIGENISNVASAVLGMPEFARGIRQQRALAPLQTAMPLMELLGMQQKMDQAGFDRSLDLAKFLETQSYHNDLAAYYQAQSTNLKRSGKTEALTVNGEQLTDPKSTGLLNIVAQMGAKTHAERVTVARQYADMIEGEDPDGAAWLRRYADQSAAEATRMAAARGAATTASTTQARIDADVVTPESVQAGVDDAVAAGNAALSNYRDYDDWYDQNRRQGESYKSARARFDAEKKLVQRAIGRIRSHVRANPGATWDDVLKGAQAGTPSNAPASQQAAPAAKPGQQPSDKAKKPMTLEELEASLGIKP